MREKKGIAVWIFGFLTFLSILHVFDAVLSYNTGNSNSLLKLYPTYEIIRNVFGELGGASYFWPSIISAFFLFGITCVFACQDPLMGLIHKIVLEAQTEENQMDQRLESSLNSLEMIDHSLTNNSIDLNEVKKRLETLRDSNNVIKTDIKRVNEKLRNLEKEGEKASCYSCGKKILPDFKLCPYCGKGLAIYENIPTLKRTVGTLKI